MAKERSLSFCFLTTLLTSSIHLCCQTIPQNGTHENTPSKNLAARNQCFSSCGLDKEYVKTRSWSRSPQNVKNSSCYQECMKSKLEGNQQPTKGKKRRTTPVVLKNKKYECPFITETTERKLGDIQNLSVVFVQQSGKDGSLTWFANVTWDVFVFNESIYFSDEWSGFLIVWVDSNIEGPATAVENYCGFISKNSTNFIIKSGSTEWVYPHAIDIGVSMNPPTSVDNMKGFDLSTFDPKVANKTSPQTTTKKSIPTFKATKESVRTFKTSEESGPTFETTKESVQIATSPPPTSPLPLALSILFGSLSGCTIVIIVAYLTWKRRNKKAIMRPVPGNYKYDASILYSTKDEQWVTTELVPLLETQHNFKCFIHFRDFEIGRVLHENMADAVYKCRKNLAVVSKNFLSSNYCKEELHMALDRVHRHGDYSLIVLNLDGVSKDRLPKALLRRTFVNLTNSQERKTWKHRLVRTISVEKEDTTGHTSPENSYVRLQNNTRLSVVLDGNPNPNESVI